MGQKSKFDPSKKSWRGVKKRGVKKPPYIGGAFLLPHILDPPP